MRALGWEIGDECYSTVSQTSYAQGERIMPGSKGRVIGPCIDTVANSDQQVLVLFDNGMLVNAHATDDLVTAAVWQQKVEQVQRTSCLMLPNTPQHHCHPAHAFKSECILIWLGTDESTRMGNR